jgi:NADPH:quinone reductase-like Zn-dependent oxidoreductase
MNARAQGQPGQSRVPAAARAFWVTAPGHAEIRTEAIAAPSADALLVRSTHGAISKGTETLVYRGGVPPRTADRMRCPFQVGEFPGPVKYGYSTVGTVIDGSEDWIGRSVFCLHPHQDFFTIPVAAARPLPIGVPPARAVLAANMETALNALWDARIRRGDQVCVIGGGVVGMLAAYLARRIGGARVDLIDIDPRKSEAAKDLGATFLGKPSAQAAYPVVIHASGSPGGLVIALEIAGFEGRIIELSWYGRQPVTLPLGEDFHDRRLTLQSSQVGAIAPSRRGGWTHARRLDRALELLRDPCLDVLISGESRFDDLPRTLAALAEGELSALCHRIIYP